MKKILLAIMFFSIVLPVMGQRYVGYQRWGKYTDAQMNAIDTSNPNEYYEIYNTTQGKKKCNDGGAGWVDCFSGSGVDTDDQQITTFSITSNTLTLALEDGGSENVDLSPYLDNKNVASGSLSGSTLTLTLSDATTVDIDLSGLSGGSGSTNLSYTPSTRLLESDSGTDVTLPLATTSDPGLLPANDKQKLEYITINGSLDFDSLPFELGGKENLTNKVTDLSDPNDMEYPTTLAVANAVTPQELTQAEFDALTTAEKKALGMYVIVPPAPSGYTVTIDNDPVLANGSDSFTWAGAEVGSFYDYSFTSSGGGTPVTGFGEIATATDQITGIDLSGLTDGTITLTAYLWNAGGDGVDATDTAEKGSAIVDLFPTGNSASAGAGEADSTSGWVSSGGTAPITSVANADGGGGGSYMIDCGCTSAGFRTGTVSASGHTVGLTYTATIRYRITDGTGQIFNWSGVTGQTYTNLNNASGNWEVGTVTYEATSTTVDLKVYPCDNDGTATGTIEVSEITIAQD